MKLRLTEKGFETYTGQFGILHFDNGLSVNDVSEFEARRVACVMQCRMEDNTDPGAAQQILDYANTPAAEGMGKEPELAAVAPKYTAEDLGRIADDKGIAGLREIAGPLGVTGKSIKDLIDGIVKAGV